MSAREAKHEAAAREALELARRIEAIAADFGGMKREAYFGTAEEQLGANLRAESRAAIKNIVVYLHEIGAIH